MSIANIEININTDIIIINDQPIFPMSVIKVRPIGVLLMRDGLTEDNYVPEIPEEPVLFSSIGTNLN